MNVRLLAAVLLLMLAVPAYAQQQQPQQQPQDPPQQEQNPDEPMSFEEQVVVSASRTEQQLVNAPATVSLITTETIQNSPATNIGDLLRAVPGVNVAQTLRTRRQHHEPRRHLHALHVAARAGRRPQRLPRLLRHGDVGPPALQPERHPPDRSDPRPGVGGVGRERDDRRDQRHHEEPARAGGAGRHVADDRPRHLRS